MHGIALEQTDTWLCEPAGNRSREVTLLPGSSTAEGASVSGGSPAHHTVALFLHAFAHLVICFGEPDFPSYDRYDWPTRLEISTPLVAVWDFDYYQLSLSGAIGSENDMHEGAVLLTRHSVKMNN